MAAHNEKMEAAWLEPGDIFHTDADPREQLRYISHQSDDKVFVENEAGETMLIPASMIIVKQ